MANPTSGMNVRMYDDLQSLSCAAAGAFLELAQETVAAQGRFTLVLSGGSTPRTLYRVLADECRAGMPWAATHVFFGDERCVPHDDPDSNYRLAREALLERVPIPPDQAHPMPTSPADQPSAAAEYEATLRASFPGEWPRFDLVFLGLGEDGHTASLFPGSPALRERRRWVVASVAPTEPRQRLTLTYPVLNHAARVWFLVSGASKHEALRCALLREVAPEVCPAAGVNPADGELLWWVDEAAYGSLNRYREEAE